MAKQTREECIRQASSNFTPEQRRRMWGTDRLDDLTDEQITSGVRHQKILRRDAKTGRILEDYRLARVRRYVHDYQQKNGVSDKNRRKAIENVLVRSLDDNAGRVSIEANAQGITAIYQSRIAQAAEAMKPDRLGWRKQVELLDDLAEELHKPKSTGNARASQFAKAVADVLEDLRLRFNRAGGEIKQLEGWALPHTSDSTKMARAGVEQYVETTLPLLDRNRMRTPYGRPMDEKELRESLRAIYSNTVGETLAEEGQGPQAIANRYQEHRQLHFRNGKEYREYADKFGDTNYYKVITDHIERLSREIALIETLGPNPAKAFERMTAGLDKAFLVNHEAIFKNLAGLNRPDKGLLMNFNAGLRPALSAAQLGSATISSFSDIGTASVAAAFNGLGWSRMLRRLGSLTGEESRVFAARLGGSIDYALDNVGIAVRFDDTAGADWSQRLADTVFRASGLNAFTNLMRRAHFIEMAYTLASHRGKSLDAVEPRFRKMLESYGIDGLEWDLIRKAKMRQRNGEQFLDVTSIQDEGVQTKLMGIIHQERDLAVLMPDTRTRALMNQGQEQGTVLGEGLRAFGQYKSYSVMMVMNNLHRYLSSKRLNTVDRVGYISSLVVSTTLLGALSLQLKEVAKGRDPRNMRDTDFFKAALLQGGGLGIMGDFFFSDSNRYGQPGLVTALGPTGGFAYDIYRTGRDMIEDENLNASRMLRYTPGQSLWYGRLIFDRNVIDQFQRLADPDYMTNKRAQVRRRKTQQGQDYFWPPARSFPSTPERAPDAAAATETPPQRGNTSWINNLTIGGS
ncbi:hypothetical protein CWI75_10690 [Kineobactrum sediminis]|uniref:Uncharacterized protein n=1 Tax=Kineobactrum sediminis TaxID=1905677 RepID=A0A2N5Y1G3_9GAMM|nr:hypothetical protein [Kineobactrum sediminis]PLW82237.1 hypothetical protein CWI75_10690 [Kineobactrum sediminis]